MPTRYELTDPQPAAADPATTALVVGHDGHPASQTALRCALRLAEQLHADLHVLHSITLDDYGIDPDIEAFEQECDATSTQSAKQSPTPSATQRSAGATTKNEETQLADSPSSPAA